MRFAYVFMGYLLFVSHRLHVSVNLVEQKDDFRLVAARGLRSS